MEPMAVSLKQAAEMLSVSTFTLRRMIKRKAIRTTNISRRVVIPMTELRRLVRPQDGEASARQTVSP
jgi:excisionase family DNA binding protein